MAKKKEFNTVIMDRSSSNNLLPKKFITPKETPNLRSSNKMSTTIMNKTENDNLIPRKRTSLPKPTKTNNQEVQNSGQIGLTKKELAKKQDKLIAGDNIEINGNVISATGGGGGGGESIQKSTMPEANEGKLGKIYQYVGETSETYTNGYWYKCVVNDDVYSWTNIDVQEEQDLSDYVQKDGDKVLSDNNYTDAEKTKLSGIASGAQVNVKSNWTESSSSSASYIQNKPSTTRLQYIWNDNTTNTYDVVGNEVV